jgi:hypothetical protein
MNKALKWGKKVAYGGFLGFCISAFFAEYTSQYLYAHYQSWSGWRSITGSNPNFLTSIILKASWAAFFLSTWFMIWRLDSFFNLPQTKRKETEDTKSKSPPQEEHEKEKKNPKPEEPQSSELDEEKVEHQTIFEPEETAQNTTFSSDDIKYAKVLGLEQPFESKDIKTTYRKIIAQYHPDRVIAMGPEIQEVAEKKAKEINEAYEHLRKSLNLP